MDSSHPRVDEGREGSLPSDEDLEETQNVKGILPMSTPSREDMDLCLPSTSATPTGSEDHPEASTSQGVSGVDRWSTSPVSRCSSCSSCSSYCSFLARQTNATRELLQLINDWMPDLLVASQEFRGAQICCSSSTVELLAIEMVARVSMLQADDVLQSVQQETALELIVEVIENVLAGWATLHPEEQTLAPISCVRNSFSALLHHVQTLLQLERSKSSETSSERSLGGNQSNMPLTNIVQAVDLDTSSLKEDGIPPAVATAGFQDSAVLTKVQQQMHSKGEEEPEVDLQFLARVKDSFQKALMALRRPHFPQVILVAASTSVSNLEQTKAKETDQEPLYVRMFRAVRQSKAKAFCCQGDSTMVYQ